VNKSELIEELSMKLALHPKKSETIVNTVFDSIIRSLKDSQRVEIRGFGSFMIRNYKPYVGRNPKSGEKIKVRPKSLPFFKTGKDMRDRVNAAN
jgi:integration host factor subunit beta